MNDLRIGRRFPLVRLSLTEQHMFVCHSDGSACVDGCDVAPIPGKLEKLEALLNPDAWSAHHE